MNNGLNDEGKNVIKEVDNNSNFAENLTKFYNNKDLVDKNKNTTMMSDTVKLNKAEDTSEASNAIYDFPVPVACTIPTISCVLKLFGRETSGMDLSAKQDE